MNVKQKKKKKCSVKRVHKNTIAKAGQVITFFDWLKLI